MARGRPTIRGGIVTHLAALAALALLAAVAYGMYLTVTWEPPVELVVIDEIDGVATHSEPLAMKFSTRQEQRIDAEVELHSGPMPRVVFVKSSEWAKAKMSSEYWGHPVRLDKSRGKVRLGSLVLPPSYWVAVVFPPRGEECDVTVRVLGTQPKKADPAE